MMREILEKHKKCLLGEEGGKRANLSGVNLRWANLTEADLSGADLTGADLTGANLSGANLSGAYLRVANLRGANLCWANLSGADLRGADLRGADLRGVVGLPAAPIVPDIDVRILAAIEAGGSLEMGSWHTCETTHCRAGWAIHLAGEAGYALEAQTSSYLAGRLIYEASRPGVPCPDFFATNDEAFEDIRRCATAANDPA